MSRSHGALVQQVGFRSKDAPQYAEAVTAYCRKSGDLAAVAVDALCDPQVSLDGLRLVGRVPSELAEQLREYSQDHGSVPTVSAEVLLPSRLAGLGVHTAVRAWGPW